MEIKVENGAVCANGLGLPEVAEGLDAVLQRAYNRLNILRGRFLYDRSLGSRIPEMDLTAEEAGEKALRFAQEALLGCPEITVEGVEVLENAVAVTLSTPLGTGSVTVYGKERKENDI